jgi:thiol-disulfide isomerase/thioredoxin
MSKPRHSWSAVRSLAIFGLGLVLSAVAFSQTESSKLPQDLNDKPTDPLTSPSGQVVVLLFLRTDCPISNRYAPAIQQLAAEFRNKARFWLVYPDSSESPDEIREHLRRFQYALPALRDVHHTLVHRSSATILPEAAVFDANGKLAYHGRIDNRYEDVARPRPAPTSHDLQHAIRAVLAGKMVQPDHADAVGCYISDLK